MGRKYRNSFYLQVCRKNSANYYNIRADCLCLKYSKIHWPICRGSRRWRYRPRATGRGRQPWRCGRRSSAGTCCHGWTCTCTKGYRGVSHKEKDALNWPVLSRGWAGVRICPIPELLEWENAHFLAGAVPTVKILFSFHLKTLYLILFMVVPRS